MWVGGGLGVTLAYARSDLIRYLIASMYMIGPILCAIVAVTAIIAIVYVFFSLNL